MRDQFEEAREEQQLRHQAKENESILTWLSQLSFEDKQKDVLSKHHPETGRWFLELDEFQKWRDGDPDTSPILWCPGMRTYHAPFNHVPYSVSNVNKLEPGNR